MQHLKKILGSFALVAILVLAACSSANDNAGDADKDVAGDTDKQLEKTELILATTTSTQDSGLLDELLPIFEKQEGYKVKTIAVGTGQALAMGEKGEADVLLTHAPASEQELVDSGDVVNYKRVMYNDFIIVGHESDAAGIKGLEVADAMKKLADEKAIFVSRGDDSGTHKKELAIWEAAGIDPAGEDWYVETGQGMGNTLQVAAEKQGYVLTDRATYLAHVKNYEDMVILVDGDEDLLNIYHVMEVNNEKHDKVNAAGAKAFVEFMTAEATHDIIAEFGKAEYGEPLFFSYLD